MTTWHEIKLMFGNFTSARKTILHCDNITKLPRIANGWYLFFSLLCVVFQIGGNPLYELSDDPWQKSKDIFVTTVPIQPHSTCFQFKDRRKTSTVSSGAFLADTNQSLNSVVHSDSHMCTWDVYTLLKILSFTCSNVYFF